MYDFVIMSETPIKIGCITLGDAILVINYEESHFPFFWISHDVSCTYFSSLAELERVLRKSNLFTINEIEKIVSSAKSQGLPKYVSLSKN